MYVDYVLSLTSHNNRKYHVHELHVNEIVQYLTTVLEI